MRTLLDAFTQAYVMCALWSSTDNARDDGGDPLDKNYSADDIAPETLERMRKDCTAFQEITGSDLESGPSSLGSIWIGPGDRTYVRECIREVTAQALVSLDYEILQVSSGRDVERAKH